jgi:hypothetical protein
VDDVDEILEANICGYSIVSLVSSAYAKFGGNHFVATKHVEGVADGDDEADV